MTILLSIITALNETDMINTHSATNVTIHGQFKQKLIEFLLKLFRRLQEKSLKVHAAFPTQLMSFPGKPVHNK